MPLFDTLRVRPFILYIGLHKSRYDRNQLNRRMQYITDVICEPIKKGEKNRAETTSLSSALTSLPSHVTEVISSLGWTRAWTLYFTIRTEQFLKRKFIRLHNFFFLNKLFLVGKARSSPVISTGTSFGESQLSNAQVYGEIWLGSSENNGFVVIQKSKGI